MQSSLTFLRKVFWLSVAGMLTQFVLMFAMKVGLELAIDSVTRNNPGLLQLYTQVQEQSDFGSMTLYASDLDRFFRTMDPIFSRLNWHVLALLTGLAGFSLLGYTFGRLAGTLDYLGMLILFSLPTGQNPITVALILADRGVDEAQFGWPSMLFLLLTQMLALYLSGWLGMQAYRRARARLTKR